MDTVPRLTEGGLSFRDLNKNGRLDPYEDPRRPVEERVADLLAQMTLEEKGRPDVPHHRAGGPGRRAGD